MWNSRKNLGLAVTEQGIAAVEVGFSGPRRTVLRTAALSFSEELNLSRPDRLGVELKQLLRRNGFSASRCVIGLPASWTVAREKVVPATDADSLRGVLALAAEREFASPSGELVFDYVAGSSGQGTAALLVAAPRRTIEQLSVMARAAGLAVTAVTSSAVALALVSKSQAPPAGRLILCLLSSGVEAVLQSPGGVRLVRHLPVRLDVPGASLDALGGELRRLLALAPGGQESDQVRQVLVWDSVGRDAALLNSLAGQLALPWKLCTLEADLGVAVSSTPTNGRWAQAAALACDEIGPMAMDFLHSHLAPARKKRVKRWMVLAVAACAVLLAAGLYLVLDWRAKQQEVLALGNQLSRQKDAIAEAKAMVDDVTFARTWYDRRPAMLDCLKEITGAFPQEGKVWATSLLIRQDTQALLTGKSVNEAAVLEMLDRLKANPRLTNVKPMFIRQAGGASRDVSFAVGLSLRGGS